MTAETIAQRIFLLSFSPSVSFFIQIIIP